jgi:acyl-CoA dehydrogenase
MWRLLARQRVSFKLCFLLQTLFAVAAAASQVYAIGQAHPARSQRKPAMPIDFEIPAEAKAIREKVRKWVHDECIPAEKELETKPLADVLGPLRKKARAQGLWCPWVPKEYGGMGLGPLANALVQMELGESMLGALSMNTQGPDDASMMTILAHGTEYQKEKFLKPLLNGDKRICFSMTEKAAGADATGMQTTAVKDGNENYILNGEKWFSSSASVADMALVMAKTDPNAPRHKQYSTFLVELPNPGYKIKRNVANMAIEGPYDDVIHGGHSEIEIRDLKVPADNLVGGEGNGFAMGQHRLAYGRLRHGMHNVAKAQRALDMAVAHVTKRSTFGQLLADRQAVQFMLADCASELYIGRLMLMHIAYKAEKGLDIRQENSIAKIFHAHMVHKVIDTAIQLHGALGFSQDTPLAKWYTQVRSQRLVDGPDEVHKWKIGKNVIKAFREHGTTASAAGGDLL